MRRGSATIYSILNTSHIKAAHNHNLSRNITPNHLLNSPIKKASSLNSNIIDLIQVIKKNNNIKSRFAKETKNIQIDNDEKRNNNKFNINYFNNAYQKNSSKKDIYNKFISFRKLIYKKAILDKYFTPYLKLNSLKNEIYTKESEIPRLFHIYLINYILQNKKCKLCSRYNDIKKTIDKNDYLITFYNIKQISYIIKYLLGCIYNQDIYTFNQIIDNWNNHERIIINYKTTKENIINNYIQNQKDKKDDSNLMLKQYTSKINIKNYKYCMDDVNYKYLFIEELPVFSIPNIMPNYLGFGGKILKLLKNFIYKHKFNKIKTKYNMNIKNQKINSKKEIEEIINMISNVKDEDSFDIENNQENFHHNTDLYDNFKKSFSNHIYNKNEENNYYFSSSESEDEYLSENLLSDKNNKKKHFFLFSKNKLNNKDKRIKNDGDILEVEKLLDKFSPRKMNKRKSKKNSKKIDNKKIVNNNTIANNINADNIIKLFHNFNNISSPKQKININNISKEKHPNYPLITKHISKNKNNIECYNDKTNINKKDKKNNEFISLSYNNQKKTRKLNIEVEDKNTENFDFNKIVYNLISSKNYSSYNKKYYYNSNVKKINIENISQQKTETNTSIEKNNKFKRTIEFVNNSDKNKKFIDKRNKIINKLIVETQGNKNCIKRSNNILNQFYSLELDNNMKENQELERNLNKINLVFYKIKKKRNSLTFRKNNFFKNAITSKKILKYGDIYF